MKAASKEGDGRDLTSAAAAREFHRLREQSGRIDPDVLDRIHDALEPVRCESILGMWRGGDFDTGHPGSIQLRALRWYGKAFHSTDEVDPLICRDDQGRLYSDLKSMGGGAVLRMIEHRGIVSAAMVYDARPVIDHFRAVDDTTLMGVMTGKGVLHEGHPYYFFLERDDAAPAIG